MLHRAWILIVAATLASGVSVWAQNQLAQGANFGGFGTAGGASLGSIQSLGTVPVFAGQARRGLNRGFHSFMRGRGGRLRGRRRSFHRRGGFRFGVDLGVVTPGYFAPFYGYGYPYDYSYPYESETEPYEGEGEIEQGGEAVIPERRSYLTFSTARPSEFETGETAESVAISFKSIPAGADILVDGYLLGRTPATLSVPLGKHLISIQKWGFDDWRQNLNVSGAKPVTVDAKLAEAW